MFSHTKFQIGFNICHITFLQCGQTKPHSSSLKIVENSTSNFHQSEQICCGEEQQSFLRYTQAQEEENNGNFKAFCVTRKRNK